MAAGISCPSEPTGDGEVKENEEGDVEDEEWFEIADFSTVTAWERLAAQLEHLIRQAEVSAPEAPSPELSWGGQRYELHAFGTHQDQPHCESHPVAHHISRYFSLPRLLLLRPVALANGDRAAMWLGALVYACGCAKVDWPCFVEQGAQPHLHSLGHSRLAQHTIRYRVEHFSTPPPECSKLGGLQRLFSRLLGGGPPPPLLVSAQHSYSIAGYAAEDWQEVTCPLGSVPACSLSMTWGTTADPIEQLRCELRWPALPNDSPHIVADQLHAIDPATVAIQSAAGEVGVLLGDQVREFLDVVLEHQYQAQGLSDRDFRPEMFLSRRKQCDVLVATGRDAGALVLRVGTLLAHHQTHLLTEEQALEYVQAVFSPSLQCLPPEGPPGLASPALSLYAPDTMPALLAYQAAQVVALQQSSAADSVAAVLRLWRRFAEAVRLFWEAGETLLPHVHPGPPDWSSCLLHQKLQMVNACIAQQRTVVPVTPLTSETDGWDLDLGDEDIEPDSGSPTQSPFPAAATGGPASPAPALHAEGRLGALRPLGDAALLRSGRALFIPATQQPLPVTEDMVGQQQEVFSRLGTSREAHRLRTRLQTGSLQSDMQAFKAANPFDPCLVDFVRWYSPKDFSAARLADFDREHGLNTGCTVGPHEARELHCLSARMQEPGNVWQVLWEESAALPVSEQRQGFDAVREANVALHFLEQLPVLEVLQCLADHWVVMAFAALAHAPITALVPHARAHAQRLADALTAALVPGRPLSLERYVEVCNRLDAAEAAGAAAVSLLARFGCPPTATPDAPLASLVSRILDAEGTRPVEATVEEWHAIRDVIARHPVEEREYRLGTEDGLQRLFAGHTAAGVTLATALAF